MQLAEKNGKICIATYLGTDIKTIRLGNFGVVSIVTAIDVEGRLERLLDEEPTTRKRRLLEKMPYRTSFTEVTRRIECWTVLIGSGAGLHDIISSRRPLVLESESNIDNRIF